MDKVALGRKIREARIKKGYTQQTLSEKADIGEMYLSEIERGIKMPSMNLFIKLITALDISADYVLRDEVPTGKEFVYDEITQNWKDLLRGSAKQRRIFWMRISRIYNRFSQEALGASISFTVL